MGTTVDSLLTLENADRVHYATGVLLDAEDFQAEQDYHRGRLARALAYVIGTGTVAGLKVVHEPAVEPSPGNGEPTLGREERLLVEPGLAIDRLGRMIEVPRPICIRLNRWYETQPSQILHDGWHRNSDSDAAMNGVMVDLFIRFVACERGKTPAFASGAFDSINAVTASRVRDGFEASLVVRTEAAPLPVPEDVWGDLSGLPESERPAARREAVLNAWREGTGETDVHNLELLPEHVQGQDPTSLLLARITIAASEPEPGASPERITGRTVQIDQLIRPFVFTANALARWIDV